MNDAEYGNLKNLLESLLDEALTLGGTRDVHGMKAIEEAETSYQEAKAKFLAALKATVR